MNLSRSILVVLMLLSGFRIDPARAQSLIAQPSTAGENIIDGVLLNVKTGLPISGANMTLSRTRDRTPVADTATDEEGRFSFANLPDGKFSLGASHRGFIAADYDQHETGSTAIVTGQGLISTGLRFMLAPEAVVFGVVADDSGDPVPQANITLYRQDSENGSGKVLRSGGTSTDEQGNYEIVHLAPGNYFLSVSATPWYATHSQTRLAMAQLKKVLDLPRSPLDVAFPTTFYPNVTDSAFAAPVPVSPGDRIPVNITLHPVPALHISMQVPLHSANHQFTMPQLHQQIFGASENIQAYPTFVSNDTDSSKITEVTIELAGLAPGQYEVAFLSQTGETSREARVDLSSDQSVDASSAVALADVSGKFAAAGSEALPPELFLLLSPQDGDNRLSARIEADGSFQLHSVPPGAYELTMSARGIPMTLTQLSVRGATVSGHLLKVGTEPVTLAALLSENTATVSGFVKQDGKPAAGVFLLLVPNSPDAGHDAWRNNQSDSDGSFDFPHVVPGQYTLLAIQDGWSIDWARPEIIAPYLKGGLKVTVTPHANEIHLKDAVEVQAK